MVDSNNLESRIVEIYNLYYLDVYRFLVCFSGNQNDAEDLTQEVFIRVLKSLTNFNGKYNLKTWIFFQSQNMLQLIIIEKKRFVSLFKDIFFNQLSSNEKKPDEVFEVTELKRCIHEAIAKLKPNYRAVMILRGISECSIKETSDILQCSEAKVKVDYHRALKELKRKLNIDIEGVLTNAK